MTNRYAVISQGFGDFVLDISDSMHDFPDKEALMNMEHLIDGDPNMSNGELHGVSLDSFFSSGRTLGASVQRMTYAMHMVNRFRPNARMQALYVSAIPVTFEGHEPKIHLGVVQIDKHLSGGGRKELAIVATGLKQDGLVSTVQRQIEAEQLLTPMDYTLIPGWITGASEREGTYHLSSVYVAQMKQKSSFVIAATNSALQVENAAGYKVSEVIAFDATNDSVQELLDGNGPYPLQAKSADVLQHFKVFDCSPSDVKATAFFLDAKNSYLN